MPIGAKIQIEKNLMIHFYNIKINVLYVYNMTYIIYVHTEN